MIKEVKFSDCGGKDTRNSFIVETILIKWIEQFRKVLKAFYDFLQGFGIEL